MGRMDSGTLQRIDGRRLRLWAEFAGFFVVAPVALAVLLPADVMFTALFVFTGVGLVLLHLTPGFHWHDLTRGWGRIDWRLVAVFTVTTAVVAWAVVMATRPGALLGLYRFNPELWLMIMALYPVLSALPQEIVFRPLFFRRYGPILPPLRAALVLNAAIFSLAHLLYWSWVVAVMTFVGGLVFAWAYEARRSFPMAVILHAIAGNILFTVGLGMFFYTGNIQRPF
jgi:uncharacterized protein